jgi:hypothetical protein
MKQSSDTMIKRVVLAGAFGAAATMSLPRGAQADTSVASIIAGATAIVGALLMDGNNQPYYINDNRKYYVTQSEASYWRAHHHVVVRQAYVPENEYPVQRNAGYQNTQPRGQMPQQNDHSMNNQDRGNQNQGHGNQGQNQDHGNQNH